MTGAEGERGSGSLGVLLSQIFPGASALEVYAGPDLRESWVNPRGSVSAFGHDSAGKRLVEQRSEIAGLVADRLLIFAQFAFYGL